MGSPDWLSPIAKRFFCAVTKGRKLTPAQRQAFATLADSYEDYRYACEELRNVGGGLLDDSKIHPAWQLKQQAYRRYIGLATKLGLLDDMGSGADVAIDLFGDDDE